MSVQTNSGKALKASEALAIYTIVSLASDNQAKAYDGGEMPFGVTQAAVEADGHVAVKLFNDSGTFKVTVNGAVAKNQVIYPASGGKASGVPLGSAIGIAMEAASGDGSIIEVLPIDIPNTHSNLIFEAVTANKTLAATDVGKVLYVTTDAVTVTLPATAAGLQFIVMNGGSISGGVGVTVSPNAADKLMGAGLAGTDNKDRINTKATAEPGDFIKLVADGSAGYYIVEEKGTWANEA